jgi:hypothetical protein
MEKLIRSKRGELGENLVIMVLAVAAFAIVLWALGGVLSHAESAEAENLCRSSVALRASSMTTLDAKVISGEVKSPLFCKVIDEKISGDKEELMSQISEKMADCWKMFG